MEYKIVEKPERLDGLRVIQNEEEALKAIISGETVCRYERGSSMTPILVDGSYARLVPIKDTPSQGDAVFCRVKGYLMTHMVLISNKDTGFCLIGSTHGSIYGWTDKIYAKALPMPYIEKE